MHDEPLIEISTSRTSGDRTNILVFTLVCILCGISSGGLILGVGPFLAKMVDAGYFVDRCEDGETGCTAQYAAIGPIFNGGFQIMTWFSCVAGVMCDRYGARIPAMLGMLMAAAGHYLLFYGFDSADTSVLIFTIGYGLIGAGGNMMYIPAFQFAGLFQAQGLPCSIISGMFNLSGMVFLLFNSPAVSLKDVFSAYFYFSLVIFVFVAVIFPDVPYSSLTEEAESSGDYDRNCPASVSSRPASMSARSSNSSFGARTAATSSAGVPLRPMSYQLQPWACSRRSKGRHSDGSSGGGGSSGTNSASLWDEIRQPRYIAFVMLFSWAALINVVIGGLVNELVAYRDGGGGDDGESAAAALISRWMYPLIGNSTFLFSPMIGALIDRRGFVLPMLLLILVTLATVVFAWLPSLELLYLMLIAYNFLGAINFTLEFSYIAISFPPELYGSLIAVTIGIQSLVGFIAWPGLSPSPFAPGNFTPTLLILLLPIPMLLTAPYFEYKHVLAAAAKMGLPILLAGDAEHRQASEGPKGPQPQGPPKGRAPLLLHAHGSEGGIGTR
jgi:MFS family permease